MRLPEHIKFNVATTEALGHKLVSQGAARFRCTRCNKAAFMDLPGGLPEKCKPGRKRHRY